MIKKKIAVVLILIMAFSALHPKPGLTFSIDARAAVLMDPLSGKVLFEQDKDRRWPPASVTKVMTMLLIMEAIDSARVKWSDQIRTSDIAAGMGGSQVYLKEGEEFPLSEMFKAIAVVSANDASTAVAEHLYGSDRDFIEAMNQKAKALGLKNTNFVNETGLPDPNHYSSAYDLAVISRELLKYPEVLKYTSIWMDTFRNG
ncbi:MAG: D-alanyl-D-alanine carboxypeptidase family protein, partial [Bacteroidota bacterium]